MIHKPIKPLEVAAAIVAAMMFALPTAADAQRIIIYQPVMPGVIGPTVIVDPPPVVTAAPVRLDRPLAAPPEPVIVERPVVDVQEPIVVERPVVDVQEPIVVERPIAVPPSSADLASEVVVAPPTVAYSPVVVPPGTAAPGAVVTYLPVVGDGASAASVAVPVGPEVIVRPKVYVRGQPIRNLLRAITP